MKPGDGAFALRKLLRDLQSTTVLDMTTGAVSVEGMPRERWQGHLNSLVVLVDVLENKPAELLSERQLIDAALASEVCQAAVLEQATEDALCGALARSHGVLVIDTTPVPDNPEPPEAA